MEVWIIRAVCKIRKVDWWKCHIFWQNLWHFWNLFIHIFTFMYNFSFLKTFRNSIFRDFSKLFGLYYIVFWWKNELYFIRGKGENSRKHGRNWEYESAWERTKIDLEWYIVFISMLGNNESIYTYIATRASHVTRQPRRTSVASAAIIFRFCLDCKFATNDISERLSTH